MFKNYPLNNFRGMSSNISEIEANQFLLKELRNGYIDLVHDKKTVIKQRWGMKALNSSSWEGTVDRSADYLFEAVWDDLTTTIFSLQSGSIFYYDSNYEPQLLYQSPGGRETSFTGGMVMFNNQVVISHRGDGKVKKVDKALSITDISTDSNLPETNYRALTVINFRIVLAHPNGVLYLCKMGDAFSSDSWTGGEDAFTIDTRSSVGEIQITDLKTIGNNLLAVIAVNETLIYRITPTPQNVRLVQKIPSGSLANTSIDKLDGDIVLYDRNNMKLLKSSELKSDSLVETVDIAKETKGIYYDILDFGTRHGTGIKYVHGVYHKRLNLYYIPFTSDVIGKYQNGFLVYNPEVDNFVGTYVFFGATKSTIGNQAGDYRHKGFRELSNGTIITTSESGFVWQLDPDTYIDDASIIDFRCRFNSIGKDIPDKIKYFKDSKYTIETNTPFQFDVIYNVDKSDESTTQIEDVSSGIVHDLNGEGNQENNIYLELEVRNRITSGARINIHNSETNLFIEEILR